MSEELTFGNWLRRRRKELSITQEELAEQLGISWITLRKLESGERHPSGQIALLLAESLKVPSDEREAFVAFARTGRGVSGAVSPTAPWRSVLLGRTNLPVPLTSILGREEVEVAIIDLLLNPKTRLLTLTGAPGIGKTRLGLQVALAQLANFEDGVFFVDLSSVTDPELVLPAIARTLGLAETAQQPLESVLLDYLRQRRMLLLLDNFEQVLDASTEVVRMMEASPWLKVLVTSREALQVRGERRFVVPPLALPDLSHLPGPDAIASYASVELFAERARAVDATFGLDQSNAQDVAALCVGLDGLPLAIELAASRADLLSPTEMRVALTSRLKLLRARTKDLPARQRTLRGAIEWSYDLLNAEEQTQFRLLGVFLAGFSASAAEAIAAMARSGVEGLDASRLAAVYTPLTEGLASLLHKNLLHHEEGSDGEVRLRMLETIREFAEERLVESGEASVIRRMHARYYLNLAEKAHRELNGPDQALWLKRLERDHDNLRVALTWALERTEDPSEGQEKLEIGLRLGSAMWRFWLLYGYFSEGRMRLEAMLAASAASARSPGVDGAGLDGLNSAAMAWVLHGIARVAHAQRDNAVSRSYGRESLASFKRLGNKKGIVAALVNLALLESVDGNYASARALHEEGLAISREAGDRPGIANSLMNLGFVRYQQGDYDAAKAIQEAGLAVWRALGDKIGIAMSISNLGSIAWLQGDYASARTLHQESLAVQQELGHALGVAYSLTNLGHAVQWLGDAEQAKELYTQSLRLGHKIGLSYCIAACLSAMGGLVAKQGQAEKSARLLGAAGALLEAIGGAWEADDRIINVEGAAIARAQLGDAAFETALAEGQTMALEEAIAYAQQDSDFPPTTSH